MIKNKKIFGVTVDLDKEESISSRSFYIGGMNCSHDVVEAGAMVYKGKREPFMKGWGQEDYKRCEEIYDSFNEQLVKYNRDKGLDKDGQKVCNIILGIECNDNVAGYFKEKSYAVPPFGIEMSISQIEKEFKSIFSTQERKAELSEIVKQIRKEVEEIKIKESEEFIFMKHSNFKGYLEDAKEIIDGKWIEMNKKKEEEKLLKIQLSDIEIKYNNKEDPQYIIRKGELTAEKIQVEKEKKEIKDSLEKLIGEIRKGLEEHTTAFYSAHPSKIDMNTMELLKTGLLTDEEYIKLAEENISNPTMYRIIANQAAERNTNAGYRLRQISESNKGKNELDLFDAWTSLAVKQFDIDGDRTEKEKALYEMGFNAAKNDFDKLPLRPTEE